MERCVGVYRDIYAVRGAIGDLSSGIVGNRGYLQADHRFHAASHAVKWRSLRTTQSGRHAAEAGRDQGGVQETIEGQSAKVGSEKIRKNNE